MTAVSVLQCVQDGLLDLDKDIRHMIHGMGKHGIITGFNDNETANVMPTSGAVTLRMLLSHTSGQEYDWMNPMLLQWRSSRGEQPFSGPTVDDKCSIPLVFEPGSSFAYGAGYDWAGKVVEVATKGSLEDFMCVRIWTPLGIEKDTSFFPRTRDSLRGRMADFSTLDASGQPPAVDFSSYDMLSGTIECLGGGGIHTSTQGYYTFLSAVFRRDTRLLSSSSYDELFRPQLNEQCEEAFNSYIYLSQAHMDFLALGIPRSVRKTWSFAGLVAKEPQNGRFGRGTLLWSGVPSVEWYMDYETGVCAVAMCQTLPPMHPRILGLHEQLQRILFAERRGS